jgi:hypothetical protein
MTHEARNNVVWLSERKAAPLTLADLPLASTRRWVLSRKAKVVMAVESGLLSFREACARYNMTLEEFESWEVETHRVANRGPASQPHMPSVGVERDH